MRELQKIGFTPGAFPVKKGTEQNPKSYWLKCRQFDAKVEVSMCRLECGEFEFKGITTSRLSIAERLPLNGFGSCCFHDEAETMKQAVMMYCEEFDLKLVETYNNWPSFRGCVEQKPSKPVTLKYVPKFPQI